MSEFFIYKKIHVCKASHILKTNQSLAVLQLLRKIKAKKVGVFKATLKSDQQALIQGEKGLQGAECEGERDMHHFVHSLRIMPCLLFTVPLIHSHCS